MSELTPEILAELGAEFPVEQIEFLPRAASGGMALGLPYLESRDVMGRLDAVVGPANWSFDFDLLHASEKAVYVRGKLTVLGVTKCDAGEAKDEDEPVKSAVSDAIKRCAVLFGVGRYLYYLPRVWAPFDPQKRRFIEQPRLDPAAVRRALALCGVGHQPAEKMEIQQLPSGAMASRQEAAANRAAEERKPTPESQGDRRATQSAPPVPSRPVVVSGRPQPPARQETPANGAALTCSRAECGRPITRGQLEMSAKNFGAGYCPACQKLQARQPQEAEKPAAPAPADGPPKDPLDAARDGYFAALGEKFGKLDSPTRYAVEAVLLNEPEPLKAGQKDDYTATDWKNFRDCVLACNRAEVLMAAKALNGGRPLLESPPASPAPSVSALGH